MSAIELADGRIEIFIHRRADRDDDGGGVFENGGVGGGLERPVRIDSASSGVGVVLVKRHPAAVDQGHALRRRYRADRRR